MDYHVVFTGTRALTGAVVNGSFQIMGAGPLRPPLIKTWERMVKNTYSIDGVTLTNIIRLDPAPETN